MLLGTTWGTDAQGNHEHNRINIECCDDCENRTDGLGNRCSIQLSYGAMSFTINNFLDYQTLLQATEHRRFREQTVTVAERKGALWVRFYRDGVGGSRIKVTGSCTTRASATVDCSAVD